MRPDDRLLREATECVLTTVWSLDAAQLARRARKLLREHVAHVITDSTVLDDIDVMVCELATNAGLHAQGPFELRVVDHAAIPVAVEFADNSPDLGRVAEGLRRGSVPVDPDAIDEAALTLGGRGLSIVAGLSAGRCGVHTTRLETGGGTGKGVWFAIPTGPTRGQRGSPGREPAG